MVIIMEVILMAKKLTDTEVSLRFKNLYNGEYKLLEEYTTNDKIYELEHIKCSTRLNVINVILSLQLLRY